MPDAWVFVEQAASVNGAHCLWNIRNDLTQIAPLLIVVGDRVIITTERALMRAIVRMGLSPADVIGEHLLVRSIHPGVLEPLLAEIPQGAFQRQSGGAVPLAAR